MSMIHWKRALGAVATSLALLTTTAPSVAQSDASGEFAIAQQLFEDGKKAEALPHFRRAFEASASPNAHLMIARCLEALGNIADAHAEMAATVREATERARTDPRYTRTRDAAAAHLALLDRQVAKIVVALADLPGPGVVVTMNGVALKPVQIGVPIAVEPGELKIEARSPSGARVGRTIAVRAGETGTVALAFNKAPEPTAAPRPPPPPPPSGGGVRIAGFFVAGLGVAGIATFTGAGLAARGKLATLERECGSVRCTDPSYAAIVDDGKALQTAANVGLTVGVIGAVAGTLMIALGGPSRAPVRAAVKAGPQDAGIWLDGSF